MSMDEMLMNELYGSEEVQQEEQIKQAQVELVEAVAAEAGVDLNELDDDELAKFAHYVLSDEDESADVDSADVDSADVNSSDDTENNTKIASLEEADLMGRQMAHSYVDELNQIQNGDTTMNRVTLTKLRVLWKTLHKLGIWNNKTTLFLYTKKKRRLLLYLTFLHESSKK